MSLHVVGVRHHSPACARLVGQTIRALRPRHVLIEGPADMNARLDELLLPHVPPVAVFTYYRSAERSHASWTPFCRHSPEWIALHAGREVGAEVRFMDLPAWSEAFEGQANRYADRPDRWKLALEALCRRLRVDDPDTLWDHLFEQPLPLDELAEALRVYFQELRGDEPGDERDAPREAYMARALAWAVADAARSGGTVVAVCGGYHAPALERTVASMPPEGVPTAFPEPPAPEGSARHGSYLVPYSFRRLDSFVGYESGLPSPAYYDAVWEKGPEAAAGTLLESAVRRLRAKKQPVSPADLIACTTLASALARMRGHRCLTRGDLLDGVASALVKDALEAPLPWSYRGTLRPRTDPILVEVVAALSGERDGKLAPATPRPPLLADVEGVLAAHDLAPPADPRDTRTVKVDLAKEADRGRSRVLHRLRVLAIPGVTRRSGPAWATDAELVETWELSRPFEAESALIEAASYGATLEGAAAAKLEEALRHAAGSLSRLASLLGEAVFVGLDSLSTRLLPELAAGAQAERHFGELGTAAGRLLGLWRHGGLLGAEHAAPLGHVLEACAARGLWLVEGILAPDAPADEAELAAMTALRDVFRFGGSLDLPRAAAEGVMSRRAADPDAPPALQGAAVGFLWSLGLAAGEDGEALARRALLAAARPATMGDFLAGLFAVAREESLAASGLVAAIDAAVAGLGHAELLIALPSLRLAFSFFPPLEKDRLGRTIAALHGRESLEGLRRLEIDPLTVARGMALDAEVTSRAARFGLVDGLE